MTIAGLGSQETKKQPLPTQGNAELLFKIHLVKRRDRAICDPKTGGMLLKGGMLDQEKTYRGVQRL